MKKKEKKFLFLLCCLLVCLLIAGGLIGALLRLINEIKYSLSYFLPYWLVNPIFSIALILIVIYLFQIIWPWIKNIKINSRKSLNNINIKPKDKVQAAKYTIKNIDTLIKKIQDDVSKKWLENERNRVQNELSRGDLVVVFFGAGSSGKTSLIRALLHEIVGEVGAAMGSTRESNQYKLRLKGIERGIKLIDTPGIFEASKYGEVREEEAKAWAKRSDLMIFVIDSDLRATELKVLKGIASLGKRILLVLNKCDLLGEIEEQKLLHLLKAHCKGIIEPENVVSTSSSPQTIPRPGERPWRPPSEVDELLVRLANVLHKDGEELLADNILLQCKNLSKTGRQVLDKQRQIEARSIVDRYSWISSGVVAGTPLPGVDLLGTAAVNAQMVIEIAKVYGVELTKSRAQELALSVAKTLTSLGIIKGGINLISTALTLNLPTIILGRAIQAIAAAWLTRVSGASFITFFQQDQDWGDGGIEEVVNLHYDINRRASSLNKFIEIAFKKVIEPLRNNQQRKLPPRQKLQEEEDAIHPHEDLK